MLSPELEALLSPLAAAESPLVGVYERAPIHVVYGGAHLFKRDTAARLGKLALGALERYAPDVNTFAQALQLPVTETLAVAYERAVEKLRVEPVEDLRIDFEDGFGLRPDAEEDEAAIRSAGEVAQGLRDGTLPSMLGIRVKSLTQAHQRRAARTLDLFFSALCRQSEGHMPERFVVTLPKVDSPLQVRVCADLLEYLETRLGISPVGLELMVELPGAIFSAAGHIQVLDLVKAARGRCSSIHFGTYDFTAACEIAGPHQAMQHPACEVAKHILQMALAGTGVRISDGATTHLPIEIHRNQPLSPAQYLENQAAVWGPWREAWSNIWHSLKGGFYQGWDLHPAQLPVRYVASYLFFLEGLATSTQRLRTFVEQATQASRVGCVFDDAATGQGLLNFFARGFSCGALSADEIQKTGLTVKDVQEKSFLKIIEARAKI